MRKEKSPGGNQGHENFKTENTGSEEKNQHQRQAHKAELETFFRALFCNAKGGFISLRGFKVDEGTAFNAEGYSIDDPKLLPAAGRLATLAASIPGVVFCSPTATFNQPEKARNIDIFNGVALSVDLDETHPQQARELLETILGPATLVVSSGGEWKHSETGEILPKLHLHWRLTNPTTKLEEHERLSNLRKLAAKVAKGDLSAGPLAHPMRLPGSWHTKAKPRMCSILNYKQDAEIILNNAEECLQNYLNQQENIKEPKESPSNESKEHPHEPINTKYGMTALLDELHQLSKTAEGGRNNRLNQAAFCLGQLVASGDLEEGYVSSSLLTTAILIGLTQWEAQQTIKSGLEAGKCKPRPIHENGKPEEKTSPISSKQFSFIKAEDLTIDPPKWIIEDYLEANTLSIVFGDPGTGKSFIALSFAASVATGLSWNGQSVKQGSVFYIAGEGFSGISRRLAAWSKHNECLLTDAPLFISERPAQLLDQENAKLVADTINELVKQHGSPKLVIIDTLARNFGIGNENSTQDMSAFIAILDRFIRIPFNCCIVIVHHTGHGDKERARGSIALKGAADAEYCIVKQNGIVTMTTTKMKDAELPVPISFLLKSIEIGLVDEKNREVTSAVLESTHITNFNLEKIRDLIPAEGINQTKLLKKMKEKLQIAQANGGQLLKKGIDAYWRIEKGPKNATIYKPFFSSRDPKEQKTEEQNKTDEKAS